MNKLHSVKVEGFTSFAEAELQFDDITVLLGANGAGKSNLVSFFSMLNFMSTGALQEYVGRNGTSDSLLYYGRRTTPQMRAEVEFETDDAVTTYCMRLADAAPDTLIFVDERVSFHREGYPNPQDVHLGSGHRESQLKTPPQEGATTCHVLHSMLSRCRVYQFHDTSAAAKIRKGGYIDDTDYLRNDAGNLAAFLRGMAKTASQDYQRLVDTIRLVFPLFGDFVLRPSKDGNNHILLNWREKGHSDYLLGPHQLSDGTLRFMALAALFLQPKEQLPSVIVLDEPELGLHPYAISVFASMVKSVAVDTQVVLATQSTRLVDEFEAENVVVLERDEGGGSRCNRLAPGEFSEWLEDYSLSELWEKNIFGGRP